MRRNDRHRHSRPVAGPPGEARSAAETVLAAVLLVLVLALAVLVSAAAQPQTWMPIEAVEGGATEPARDGLAAGS